MEVKFVFLVCMAVFVVSGCVAQEAGCENISDFQVKSECYQELVKERDMTVCGTIQNQFEKEMCYSSVLEIINISDINACHRLLNQDDKSACYTIVARTTEDPPVCEMVQDVAQKDFCYLIVAKASQDLSACDRIRAGNLPEELQVTKEYCYMGVALVKKEPSICESLQNNQDLCYYLVAKARQDPALCDIISDDKASEVTMYDCYTDIAVARKDLSVCDGMDMQQFYKDGCYTGVAKAAQNITICDGIINEEARELCKTQLASM
jgi:hypothetical protein